MTHDDPLLDRMLRCEPMLARIARDIVAPDDVPDVLQRTWLAAIRGPAPEPASLGAWLARVARNFAFEHRRRETSRAARERLASERADTRDGSTEAGPARWESVARALRDLEPPYRAAIEQRYLEGLPYARIAQATGIGEAAARQRVKRGLDRLRAQLLGSGATTRRRALALPGWREVARLAAAASVGALVTLALAGGERPAPGAPGVALLSGRQPALEEHFVFLAPPDRVPSAPAARAVPDVLDPQDRAFGPVPLADAAQDAPVSSATGPGTLADASL